MDLNTALQEVLKQSLVSDGLVHGIHQACKVLDKWVIEIKWRKKGSEETFDSYKSLVAGSYIHLHSDFVKIKQKSRTLFPFLQASSSLVHPLRELRWATIQTTHHCIVQRTSNSVDSRWQQQEIRRMVRLVQNRQRRQTTKDLRLLMCRSQELRPRNTSFGHR